MRAYISQPDTGRKRTSVALDSRLARSAVDTTVAMIRMQTRVKKQITFALWVYILFDLLKEQVYIIA